MVFFTLMSGPFDERHASRAILRTFSTADSVQDCRMETRRRAVCWAYNFCEPAEVCQSADGVGDAGTGALWTANELRVIKRGSNFYIYTLQRWVRWV
jgi:hypothetical protein